MKINWFNITQAVKSLIKKAWAKIQNEPVIVRSVLALGVSAGYLELSDKQLDVVNAAVVAVVLLFGAASAREAVKPLAPSKRTGLVRKIGKGIRNGGRK